MWRSFLLFSLNSKVQIQFSGKKYKVNLYFIVLLNSYITLSCCFPKMWRALRHCSNSICSLEVKLFATLWYPNHEAWDNPVVPRMYNHFTHCAIESKQSIINFSRHSICFEVVAQNTGRLCIFWLLEVHNDSWIAEDFFQHFCASHLLLVIPFFLSLWPLTVAAGRLNMEEETTTELHHIQGPQQLYFFLIT